MPWRQTSPMNQITQLAGARTRAGVSPAGDDGDDIGDRGGRLGAQGSFAERGGAPVLKVVGEVE